MDKSPPEGGLISIRQNRHNHTYGFAPERFGEAKFSNFASPDRKY